MTGAVTGGISGRGGGISGGLVVGSSTRGGGCVEDAMPATIGWSGGGCVVWATGEGDVGGNSVAIAMHFSVGFPVVPGGHIHAGRLPTV